MLGKGKEWTTCSLYCWGRAPRALSSSPWELAHGPVPDWLGKAWSLAEPQSQEGGKRVVRGWDASSAL